MSRTLIESGNPGWYVDANDLEGKKVRKQDGDNIFDNLMEAQTALATKTKSKNGGDPVAEKKAPKQKKEADKTETLAPTGKVLVGRTITIKCAWKGCKETRVIKPQDAFQVKFCVEHQIANRKKIMKERRAEKTAIRNAERELAAAKK